LECNKKDFNDVVQKLKIDVKIYAPSAGQKMVDLTESSLYAYFKKLFIADNIPLDKGRWGCICLAFGMIQLCFCGLDDKEPHGILI
jgi:hypothetical protein